MALGAYIIFTDQDLHENPSMPLETLVSSCDMEPSSPLYSEDCCHGLCSLDLDVSTALPSIRLHSLCTYTLNF